MKLRLARPSRVVDIGGIAGLRGISVSDGVVSIGALTTHYEISTSAEVQANCGILAEAAGGVGDPAVRNRGTIGGNVSHADPASDLPTVLTALGASFNLQGPSGARTVAADDFFTGPFETAGGRRGADRRQRSGAGSQPGGGVRQDGPPGHVLRRGGRGCGGDAGRDAGGHGHDHGHDHDHDHGHHHAPRCTAARVAVGGLTPKPTRSPAVESALAGSASSRWTPSPSATALVSGDLGDDLLGDVYASADYRRNMAGVELKHALYHAVGLAHH